MIFSSGVIKCYSWCCHNVQSAISFASKDAVRRVRERGREWETNSQRLESSETKTNLMLCVSLCSVALGESFTCLHRAVYCFSQLPTNEALLSSIRSKISVKNLSDPESSRIIMGVINTAGRLI